MAYRVQILNKKALEKERKIEKQQFLSELRCATISTRLDPHASPHRRSTEDKANATSRAS
ncbi:hypothetical protein PanWU01x14_199800, partial [Parasponia andersonii]